MWIQQTGLVFAPALSQIKVTLVVCLTFALRRFSLRISLQRNSPIFWILQLPRDFFSPTTSQPNRKKFLIGHNIKDSKCTFESEWPTCSLKVNVSNPDLCTRVKSLTHGQSRRLCSTRLFRENSVKCSCYLSRWEKKCCVAPLHREGLFPEEAILVTSANPLHTPLLRM